MQHGFAGWIAVLTCAPAACEWRCTDDPSLSSAEALQQVQRLSLQETGKVLPAIGKPSRVREIAFLKGFHQTFNAAND